MQVLAGSRRWSVMTLAMLLLGALLIAPSAAAQSGTGGDRAAGGARIQRFLALSTNPKNNAKPVVLAFGPIHAKGVDTPVGNRKDIFRFPQGSLIVRHHPQAHVNRHDPVTCLNRFIEHGTYRVVRGTGAYVGARGHGHYRVQVQFVACTNHSRPQAFSLEIRAHGPMRL